MRKRLFTPGPTEVPDRVRERLSRPLVHHRTEEYRVIQSEAVAALQRIMKTKNPVLLFACSGTGVMEAAVANVTQPGEKAVVTEFGKFSGRWAEIGKTYGLEVVTVSAPWGEVVAPDLLSRALDAHPEAKVVFTTHAETSTGALEDVGAVARIAHDRGTLVVVDAIASIAADRVETDAWGLDVVIGSSQKGVMTPPGLSFLAVSEAAREKIGRGHHPAYYFDLGRALDAYSKGDTSWTPPIALIAGIREALAMIEEEGLENTIERHGRNARAVRSAVRALGFVVLASIPAACTTAVVFEGGQAEAVRKTLWEKHGMRIAGGQGPLKGQVVRLGHLGYCFENDIFSLMAAFESTLLELGIIEYAGAGVEALFQEFGRK